MLEPTWSPSPNWRGTHPAKPPGDTIGVPKLRSGRRRSCSTCRSPDGSQRASQASRQPSAGLHPAQKPRPHGAEVPLGGDRTRTRWRVWLLFTAQDAASRWTSSQLALRPDDAPCSILDCHTPPCVRQCRWTDKPLRPAPEEDEATLTPHNDGLLPRPTSFGGDGAGNLADLVAGHLSLTLYVLENGETRRKPVLERRVQPR